MQTMPLEMQAARLQLLKRHPYLASMAWALVPVQKPGLGTMAVDQYFRLYYEPGVVNIWTVEELAGVIYHEVNHLLRDHPARMRELEPQRANIACDLEINDDLKKEDIKLPDGGLIPEMFNLPEGLLAEEYYYMLDNTQQAGGTGDGQGGDSGNNGTAGSDAGNGCPKPGSGRCGSCATGQREPWEDDAPGNGNNIDGVNRAEAELIRRDVATHILQASQSRGDVPGYMVRWAEEKLRPKVDWRKELAAAVRGAIAQISGAVDYSYSKPSRRQGQVGNGKVILPSLRQPVPEVAVVVDTSGSISDTMLSQALAEVSGVLKSCGSRGATVLAVDASVHTCKKVFDAKQVKLAGGGGTDMGCGIEAATKLKPRPQVVIVLTDGYTPWPDTPPKAKVIIGMMSDQKAPGWAKTIKIAV